MPELLKVWPVNGRRDAAGVGTALRARRPARLCVCRQSPGDFASVPGRKWWQVCAREWAGCELGRVRGCGVVRDPRCVVAATVSAVFADDLPVPWVVAAPGDGCWECEHDAHVCYFCSAQLLHREAFGPGLHVCYVYALLLIDADEAGLTDGRLLWF